MAHARRTAAAQRPAPKTCPRNFMKIAPRTWPDRMYPVTARYRQRPAIDHYLIRIAESRGDIEGRRDAGDHLSGTVAPIWRRRKHCCSRRRYLTVRGRRSEFNPDSVVPVTAAAM